MCKDKFTLEILRASRKAMASVVNDYLKGNGVVVVFRGPVEGGGPEDEAEAEVVMEHITEEVNHG